MQTQDDDTTVCNCVALTLVSNSYYKSDLKEIIGGSAELRSILFSKYAFSNNTTSEIHIMPKGAAEAKTVLQSVTHYSDHFLT